MEKKMKLIDADGIISVMKQQAGCATCDNYNGIRCRACQWDDAITSVYDYADYHTVDAVPIEWISNKAKAYEHSDNLLMQEGAFLLNILIDDWKEEQEKK
jgi:hypothetical protein